MYFNISERLIKGNNSAIRRVWQSTNNACSPSKLYQQLQTGRERLKKIRLNDKLNGEKFMHCGCLSKHENLKMKVAPIPKH